MMPIHAVRSSPTDPGVIAPWFDAGRRSPAPRNVLTRPPSAAAAMRRATIAETIRRFRRLRSRRAESRSITRSGAGKRDCARSSRPRTSLIDVTFHPFQRRAGVRALHANRRCLDAEDPRGLLGAVVEEIRQDDAGALAGSQRSEGV